MFEKFDVETMSNKCYNYYWKNPFDKINYYNELIDFYNIIIRKGEYNNE